MSKVQCDICIGSSKGHDACCAQCGFVTCRPCARRWVTTEAGAHASPGCPSCNRPWRRAELRRRLGVSFLNGPYRAARRIALRLREGPRLTLLVPAAVRERHRRALAVEARLLYLELLSVQAFLGVDLPALHDEYDRLAAALRRVQRRQDALEGSARQAHMLRHLAFCAHAGCGASLSEETCAVCARKTCLECGAAVQQGAGPHVCDTEVLATRQLLLRECRPCVQCGVLSQKVEGCPTMWCPCCHAFWNWDTGRLIETNRGVMPHNPDHRAWMAEDTPSAAREVADLPCGGIPEQHALQSAVLEELLHFTELSDGTSLLFAAEFAARQAQFLREQRYPRAERLDERPELEATRIRFLVGDLTDAAFSTILEQGERDAEFRGDVAGILEAFVLSAADLLQRFVNGSVYGLETTAGVAQELQAVRAVIDEALRDAGRVHERKPPRLTESWYWDLPYARPRPD